MLIFLWEHVNIAEFVVMKHVVGQLPIFRLGGIDLAELKQKTTTRHPRESCHDKSIWKAILIDGAIKST